MATAWLKREDCEAGTLPRVCLKCGRPATCLVREDLRGCLSVLAGGPEAAIAAPLCDRHRDHWRNHRLKLGSAFLLAGTCTLLLIGFSRTEAILYPQARPFAFALAATWALPILAWVDTHFRKIRVIDVHLKGIRLENVSEAFARACDLRSPAFLAVTRAAEERWLDSQSRSPRPSEKLQGLGFNEGEHREDQ